jgi:hypothetical protein
MGEWGPVCVLSVFSFKRRALQTTTPSDRGKLCVIAVCPRVGTQWSRSTACVNRLPTLGVAPPVRLDVIRFGLGTGSVRTHTSSVGRVGLESVFFCTRCWCYAGARVEGLSDACAGWSQSRRSQQSFLSTGLWPTKGTAFGSVRRHVRQGAIRFGGVVARSGANPPTSREPPSIGGVLRGVGLGYLANDL